MPRSVGDKRREAQLLEGCGSNVSIANGLSEQAIQDGIDHFLRIVPSTWYMPNYRGAPHAGMITAKALGGGNIYVCHNDEPVSYRFATRYQSVIDRFVAPSDKCFKELHRLLPRSLHKRIVYIPHAVGPLGPVTPKTLQHRPIRLLYHGRLDYEQKQVHYLPKVAQQLEKWGFPFELHVAGDGPARQQLEDHPNFPGAEFHGYVQHDSLGSLFEACDIAILTSKYEGFCLGLAEAMRHGLPGIAMDCGGVINDFLSNFENGFIVPQGEVEQLAWMIRGIVENPDKYASMSRHAISELSDRFSITNFNNAYGNLLSEKPDVKYSWPLFRPARIPDKRLSRDGLLDIMGQRLLGWP